MRLLLFIGVAVVSFAFVACADDRSGVSSERKGAPEKLAEGKYPVVVMETSMGTIKIELDDARAPETVKNFLQYVDDKFYDGTIFHRVIRDFMIQGGGFEQGLKDAKSAKDIKAKEKKTRPSIKNEGRNGLSNVRGTIAMARTARLDSATAQFFINVKDNSQGLDAPIAPYCVFGKVIDGMDVVDKIRDVKTTTVEFPNAPPMGDVPAEDVIIKSIRRVSEKDPTKTEEAAKEKKEEAPKK